MFDLSKRIKEFEVSLVGFLTGYYPEDNKSFLVFECPVDEILNKLPTSVKDKLIYSEYNSQIYERKASA